MQSLLDASTKSSNDACARALLDTVPLVIRVIRGQMCRHRSGITIPQFRALCFVRSSSGISLSAVADFIGLSLPAMSRLVDGLVEKGLMERRSCQDDRRHVRLSVTEAGEATIDEARALASQHLSEALTDLSARQRATIVSAMSTLRDVFTPDSPEAELAEARASKLVKN
jgi:DNA-binding MarR family transcriptional regulator